MEFFGIAWRGVWVWNKLAHIPREKLPEGTRVTEEGYLILCVLCQTMPTDTLNLFRWIASVLNSANPCKNTWG